MIKQSHACIPHQLLHVPTMVRLLLLVVVVVVVVG
jgi:hypothetical protein